MIYLDSSVALAQVLSETRRPTADFWDGDIISSRLLEFEVWNRIYAYDAGPEVIGLARELLQIVDYLEMTAGTLVRALRRFPLPVRMLDGLHLATMDHLRVRGSPVTLASYDGCLLVAAKALGFPTMQP